MKASKHEIVRPGSAVALRVRLGPRLGEGGQRLTYLSAGPWQFRCAVGRSGFTRRKAEGDGATPVGRFIILGWLFRPIIRPFSHHTCPWRTIRRDSGWCDDPKCGAYNRPVRLPFARGHELLWRSDGKYDVLGVIDYNLRARKRHAGSAIFFHLCDAEFGPTAGCVAIEPSAMRKLIALLPRRVMIAIN